MRAGLLLLALLGVQDPELEAARKAEAERLAARPPVDRAAFVSPTSPAKAAPRVLRVAVQPLSFPDAPSTREDLATALAAPLERYYAAQSGGRLEFRTVLRPRRALEATRASLAKSAAGSAAEGEAVAGVLEGDVDAWILVVGGPFGERGGSLWPHQSTLERGGRKFPYVLLPEEGDARWFGAACHEAGHFLDLSDQYEDAGAKVGRWCLMGTGYLGVSEADPTPAPLCAVCRASLDWIAPLPVDPSRETAATLGPGEAARVALARDGAESLVLEPRGASLLAWHVGGGRPIELAAVLDGTSSDRLTPWSDPPLRARTPGARDAWIVDVRGGDGRAWFRVAPSAPLTPLEELRRKRVGRELGR